MALTQIGSIDILFSTAQGYMDLQLTSNYDKYTYLTVLNGNYKRLSIRKVTGYSASVRTVLIADEDNSFVPIVIYNAGLSKDNWYNVYYMDSTGSYVKKTCSSGERVNFPYILMPTTAGLTSINLSTVDPNTTIEALVDGNLTEINNTPKTVNITDGNVVVNVSTHSPKDNYTVQINNGENMVKLVDGSTQYTSFPASINVEANKTISAYGEPDKEITINYTNTGTPVITNT